MSSSWAEQSISEANGRNGNKILIFQKDIMKDDLGISKLMKISLPNLNDMVLRSQESTEKSLMGVALLLPTFPPSWKWSFLVVFFTTQIQGIEQNIPLHFTLKVLWFSNNMMQKMTSITPSIYKISHLKVFFKNFA